jgi:hypothetical protein
MTMPKNADKAMQPATSQLPARCGAHCRTTGEPCRNPPMQGRMRCRMHGGKNTGRPPTSGRYTKEALRMKERVAFQIWLFLEVHGGGKKHFRFRATPERFERLLGELIAERKKGNP